jgi:hypothetical protein
VRTDELIGEVGHIASAHCGGRARGSTDKGGGNAVGQWPRMGKMQEACGSVSWGPYRAFARAGTAKRNPS